MIEVFSTALLWIVIVGFIVAFFLAFGVGANDVANSFGTSVGSKVLSLKAACILATIFELLGALLLGARVSDTIRKGIYDVSVFDNSVKELMLGNLAALIASSIWTLIATFFSLPISGTHSIIGAVLGFVAVSKGFGVIKWVPLSLIMASWVVSPIVSGTVSLILYKVIDYFILKKDKPLEPGLISLPYFYGITLMINLFSIVHGGPEFLKFDLIPWWAALIGALLFGLIAGLVTRFFVVPRLRKKILKMLDKDHEAMLNKMRNGDVESSSRDSTPDTTNSSTCQYMELKGKNGEAVINMEDGSCEPESDDDKPEVAKLFSFLQILTAVFGSFAHGGNDVSNAIGPLISLYSIWADGDVHQNGSFPFWLLFYGGFGITVGLWTWGRKVIKTMGEDLTKIVPSSGVTIEIGAATTVLLASKVGFPISTTHCKVGSVVFVGKARSKRGVDWSLFRKIILTWVLTLPVSAIISAVTMYILYAIAL